VLSSTSACSRLVSGAERSDEGRMRALLLGVFGIAWGCSAPSTRAAVEARGGAARAPAQASAGLARTGTVGSTATASGPVPASISGDRSHPSVEPSRELVQEVACDAKVFPLGDRTLVACGPELGMLSQGQAFAAEPQLGRGLELGATGIFPPQVLAVVGTFPAAAFAATLAPESNGILLRFFRWRRDRWLPLGAGRPLGTPEGFLVFPWRRDGLAAITAQAFGPTRFLAMNATPSQSPTPSSAVQSADERARYPCQQALIAPEAWLELSPGDVLAISGQLCGVPNPEGAPVPERRLGIERFRSGAAHGELTLLPVPDGVPADVSWNIDGAAALAPNDAFVLGHGTDSASPAHEQSYAARFDGAVWRIEQTPFGRANGLWAAAGAYWVSDQGGTLWLRRAGGWARVVWSGAASPRAELTQLVDVAWGTLLVLREELAGATRSRLYRVQLGPAAAGDQGR